MRKHRSCGNETKDLLEFGSMKKCIAIGTTTKFVHGVMRYFTRKLDCRNRYKGHQRDTGRGIMH